jgi:hypothetical protein
MPPGVRILQSVGGNLAAGKSAVNDDTLVARIIHEHFCCDRGFAAATFSSLGVREVTADA